MIAPRSFQIIVGMLFGLALHAVAQAQALPTPARSGEIIVKFKAGATATERNAILSDLGAVDVQDIRPIAAKHARLEGRSVSDAVARYRNHPKVEFIEPNYVYHAFVTPNDPRFPEMWALRNVGQTGGLTDADISATQAWDITTGSPAVLVAVTDTGIDWTHPDLAANVFVNPGEIAGNGLDDDGNGYVDDVRGWDFVHHDNDPADDHGHGTHTSGTIAAIGNNATGVTGVNWSARILPLKFLDQFGNGSTVEAINAIDYAARMGARVMNASWGGGAYSAALRQAIQNAADSGMVFVAAAGNSGVNTDITPAYPASYDLPSIVSVAATDHRDQLAGFSNYGIVSVDLGAPGVDILSTRPGGYGFSSGTSMAAPHVSGVLALMFARFPGLDPLGAKALLLSRVTPLASLAGRTMTGGRLDAFLAVSDPDSTPPDAVTTLAALDPNGTRITLQWIATGDDGTTGRASRYEVRFATSPITENDFHLATLAAGAPQPAPAGDAESFTVEDLAFGTTYFFALKAFDEFGNASPISNVPSATTLDPPTASIEPTLLEADLLTGEQATRVLTVSNLGPSELHIEIDALEGLPGGVAQAATVIRTFVPPTVAVAAPASATTTGGSLLDDVQVPSYPKSDVPYDFGASAGRAPIGPDDVRVANVFAGSRRVLIAYSGGNVDEIRSALGAFPDLSVVDALSVQNTVPALEDLVAYDGVLLVANSSFGDPAGVGNVLADYVDSGGALVMTLATFISGWEVTGRLKNEGYVPFGSGSGPIGSATLASFDATHPIMAGVAAATGDLLGAVPLAAGAELVAMWSNAQPFVATKGTVSAVNIFLGGPGYWTGDIPLILHNALLWQASPGWLSVDPRSGVVPAGGQIGAVVTFDAAGLDGGTYGGTLRVRTDDPAQPEVGVPAVLNVTGAPDIEIAGDAVVLESARDYTADGATTGHSLPVAVPAGGPVSMRLIAEGDYGDGTETATAFAEGTMVGSVGGAGIDCSVAQGTFPISPPLWDALTTDGVVDVTVQNSPVVGTFCALNRHTVRLSYETRADQLDFGPVYLTEHRDLGIIVRNAGTDALEVGSIELLGAGFSAPTAGFTLPPQGTRRLEVRFEPQAPGTYSGSLIVHSNDADEPSISVPLEGVGIVPPDITVAPGSIDETLPTGTARSLVVTIENQGGSDLDFTVILEEGPATVVVDPGDPGDPAPRASRDRAGADRAGTRPPWTGPLAAGAHAAGSEETVEEAPPSYLPPGSYVPRLSQSSAMTGATVLLVQDTAPWGTQANEALLLENGFPFDVVTTSALSATNLLQYRKVIIAGDQPTVAYQRLASRLAQLEAYVAAGGILEFHAAGLGFAGGSVSLARLPGGVRVGEDLANTNRFNVASHPLLAGVPDPVTGTAASHGYFVFLPPDAATLLIDPFGRPTLVEYRYGLGRVVAATLTLEYSYVTGRDPGLVLRNMIPYRLTSPSGWLSAAPLQGRVGAGESAQLTIRLDAEGLEVGDYAGGIFVRSNDPDEPEVSVPVSMSVSSAPDIELLGHEVTVESTIAYATSGATTEHTLPLAAMPRGAAVAMLDVKGDYGGFFETASLTLEDVRLGEVGRAGSDCVPVQGGFPIATAFLATLATDGVVHATVQNSAEVGVTCLENAHRVALVYRTRPDSLSFGQVFVGSCDSVTFEIVNQGSEVLHVQPLLAPSPGLQVTPGGALTLPPSAGVTVTVRWCPTGPGPLAASLQVHSDDPDEPLLAAGLFGDALIPPEISVSPGSIEDALFTGQTAAHLVTVRNDGGSELVFEIGLETPDAMPVAARAGTPAVPPAPGQTEFGTVDSDGTPPGYSPMSTAPIRVAEARFLLVQDAAPWGSTANEAILAANGIAFDRATSFGLGSLDLSAYDKVIIASDQTTSTYGELARHAARLETYVRDGGVLEVHAAGWGWNGGDASQFVIPGGVRIVPASSITNHVLQPDHPLMAGVPNPFTGSSASHCYLAQVPADAEVLAADELGRANLVLYPLGSGAVIAGGQTFEYGYDQGQAAGIILRNMIPFGPVTRPPWIAADPLEGRLEPGESMAVTLQLNAAGLGTGDLHADVVFTSNDPAVPERRVPVLLQVTGAPDGVLAGKLIHAESTKPYSTDGATTTHDLAVDLPPGGDGTLTLIVDGDYGDVTETATAYLEGVFAGEAGRTGVDCRTATNTSVVPKDLLAAVVADGVAQVEVRNTPAVNVICVANQHHVALSYRGAGDALAFGELFIHTCRTLTVEISNAGTDPLRVEAPLFAHPDFSAEPAQPFEVLPGEAAEISVTFCPDQPGPVETRMTLRSNDPDTPELFVTLSGTGLVPPDIAVAPAMLNEALLPGGSASRTLRIANPGALPLEFRIEARTGATAPLAAPTPARRASSPLAAGARSRALDAYRAFAADGGGAEVATDTDALIVARSASPQSLRPTESANAVIVFTDDMEGDVSEWTHYPVSGGQDLWALSTQRASSGVRSWHVSQHAGIGDDALQTPLIDLIGYQDATLTFSHWYQFDDCGGSPDFEPDGGVVEVLEQGTQNWARIHPVGGYPYVLDDICGNPLAYAQAYSHRSPASPAFDPAAFDLTPFIGKRVSIRFRAGWDCGNCGTNDGWYVDDVTVYSSQAPWLATVPDRGVVPPGGVVDVAVAFDAEGLTEGEHLATLAIMSNDPDEPRVDVPVRLWLAEREATLDTGPNAIHPGRRGQWLTCYLELPGGDPATIDVASLRFDLDVAASPLFGDIGDEDQDGVPDLMVKFDFEAVRSRLPVGNPIPILITGDAGGQRLMARHFVRVVRPVVLEPAEGQLLGAGATVPIEWTLQGDWQDALADLSCSFDAGVTWHPIATGVSGTRYDWSVSDHATTRGVIRVDMRDASGFLVRGLSGDFTIVAGTTAIDPPSAGLDPTLANLPNPFSGAGTTLEFSLPGSGVVNLEVFNAAGRRIRVLTRAWMPPGRHQVRWDGRDDRGTRVGPGIYFVRLRAPGLERARKMTLIR